MKKGINQFLHRINSPMTVLIFLFVASQLYLASIHSFPIIRFETDGIGYMMGASGELFQAHPFHGPGYSWAIRLAQNLTGFSFFISAQLVSILSGVLLIYSAFHVFSLSDDRQTAYIAAVLTALTPIVLQHSNMIMSDMLAGSLLWATIWTIMRTEAPTFRYLLVAGMIAGFAYLTRYMYILLVFVPPVFFFSQHEKKRTLFAITGFYLGFCLTIYPWAAFLNEVKGSPFWSLNHLNIAFKMYRDGAGWNVFPSTEHYPTLLSVILSDPTLFIKSWFATLREVPFEAMEQIPTFSVYLGFIGLFIWVSRPTVRKALITSALVGYGLLVALVWIEPRFLIPFVPFAALCISRTIKAVPCRIQCNASRFHYFSGWNIPLRLPLLLVVFVIVINASRNIPSWFRDNQADEYVAAVNWLKTLPIDSDTTIMAAKPHIAFFSGTKGISFRQHNLQAKDMSSLLITLTTVQPDYFIYDEQYALVEFPQFSSLLEAGTSNQLDCWRPTLTVESPKRLIIFTHTGKCSAEKMHLTP